MLRLSFTLRSAGALCLKEPEADKHAAPTEQRPGS
jgi:hypothetical protein